MRKKVGRPKTDIPALPIYGSMAAAAAATGIPEPVFKRAKKCGCPAFRSTRVNLRTFLVWYFTREHGEIDWTQEREKWQAKREKLKHDKDAALVVEWPLIRSDVHAAESLIFAELERIFCNELPPVLKGRDELTIRAEAFERIELLKTALREKFAAVGARGGKQSAAEIESE